MDYNKILHNYRHQIIVCATTTVDTEGKKVEIILELSEGGEQWVWCLLFLCLWYQQVNGHKKGNLQYLFLSRIWKW